MNEIRKSIQDPDKIGIKRKASDLGEETKSMEEKLNVAINTLRRSQRELLEMKASINSTRHRN